MDINYNEINESSVKKQTKLKQIFAWPNILRAILFAVAIAIVVFLLPKHRNVAFAYEEGKPWESSMLIAAIDIPLYLDSMALAQKTDSIKESVMPNFEVENSVVSEVLTDVENCFDQERVIGLNILVKSLIKEVVADAYKGIVVSDEDYAHLVGAQYDKVKIGDTLELDILNVKSPQVILSKIDSLLIFNADKLTFAQLNFGSSLTPNAFKNDSINDLIIAQGLVKLKEPIGYIQSGERIVDRGEIVTNHCAEILEEYERILNEKNGQSITEIVGISIYVLLLFAALFCFLYVFRKDLYDRIKVIVFVLLLEVSLFGFMVLGANSLSYGTYMIPIMVVPIFILILFDSRMAMFCHFVEVLLCAVLVDDPFEFIAVQFIAGVVAIVAVRDLTRRSQLVIAGLYIFIAYVVSYVAIELMQNQSLSAIEYKKIMFLALNTVVIFISYVVLLIVEKLFGSGFTSKITYVEMSDVMNNEVLKELSLVCPGTFNHSMVLSNLASTAAMAVDAKAQMVRAGALYHDIGKMENPQYFTENQKGENPHDNLDAIDSARIVINHVYDGIKLAEKYGLPKEIQNFIKEHHGCGKAKYFYNTYVNQHPDEDVDPTPFTYPGPNPQSKETSILMMADAVEAASRSLKDYSQESINSLVDKIIDAQVAEGLHNDSPLTLKEVKKIKKSFVQQLVTIYHSRISYPEILVKKENEGNNENAK